MKAPLAFLILGVFLCLGVEQQYQFSIIEEHRFTWVEGENFLNLETGEVTRKKPRNAPFVHFSREKDRSYLILEDLHNYSVPREKAKQVWEKMKPADLAPHPGVAAIPSERTGYYSLAPKDNPQVVLIPTWGLLQIKTVGDLPAKPSVVLQVKRLVAAGSVQDKSL